MNRAEARRFLFLHLSASSGGAAQLATVAAESIAALDDVAVVGSFAGLFGVGNHDLFVLLSCAADDATLLARVRSALPTDVEIKDTSNLRATARPSDDASLSRAGIYVFRFFDVRAADVAEIVQLSRIAWETFEDPNGAAATGYRSEPMGLFREADLEHADARGRMLLLTWYDDLTSWERSRTPAAAAQANFRRRATLTTRTIAYATRLVTS